MRGILTARWLITLYGAAIWAGLVWFFGPLLGAMDSPALRVVAVLLILLVWGGANYAADRRRLQRDEALVEGVASDAADESAALRDRLAAALRSLKGSLHQRPWYAIIGPPGAGKTTALLNAGLRFPLASNFGRDPLKGIGGTRYCDWWFTGDAVLIDTAGRYTTQDSDTDSDRQGWQAFLHLLKKARPRQPLNGLIVAIALADVAQDAELRMAHARAIRRRVRELQAHLGVRLPIYVLFTKADLIAGFSEFFDDMDAVQREQVWGTTFDPASDESNCVEMFARDFRIMSERLQARLFQRLGDERSPARRGLIALFPAQFASLEQPLVEFLKAAFSGYPVQFIPRVRGVYLSSATQEGTPFDRLTGVLSRAFGLPQRRAASLTPQQGRSYFLHDLLQDVIFGEAMLMSEPPAIQHRRRVFRAVSFAGVALTAVMVCGLVWASRDLGVQETAAGAASVSAYEQAARVLPLDPIGDADLPRLLPLLDDARAASQEQVAQPWLSLGLSQTAKMAAAGRVLYRHALERTLLPRLLWQMETQIRDNLDSPDFLYEATRVYLMLGSAGPLDPSFVQEWMRLAWQNMYPGIAFATVRERLMAHLAALLAEPLPAVSLDGELITRARGSFGKVSMAQRAYSGIRLSAAAQRVAPWRPSDTLNVAGMALFIRTSGKPLSEGVAGFYTVEGFHHVVLPALAKAAKEALTESWVVGQRNEFDPNGPALPGLERDVIGLYENDYQQTWDAMLADLNMVPLSSVSQAAQDLYILASPQSPIRSLLVSVARQLTLSVPPGKTPGAQADVSTVSDSGGDRLLPLLGTSASVAQRPAPPGYDIDLRYSALREIAGVGGAAPIDQVLRSLNDTQQQFAKAAAASGSGILSGGTDPALALKVEALRQPQPLARWLITLAAGATALRNGDKR